MTASKKLILILFVTLVATATSQMVSLDYQNLIRSVFEGWLLTFSYLFIPFGLILVFDKLTRFNNKEFLISCFLTTTLFLYCYFEYLTNIDNKGAWVVFLIHLPITLFGLAGYWTIRVIIRTIVKKHRRN